MTKLVILSDCNTAVGMSQLSDALLALDEPNYEYLEAKKKSYMFASCRNCRRKLILVKGDTKCPTKCPIHVGFCTGRGHQYHHSQHVLMTHKDTDEIMRWTFRLRDPVDHAGRVVNCADYLRLYEAVELKNPVQKADKLGKLLRDMEESLAELRRQLAEVQTNEN